jgi:hypothetical protein
LSRQRDILAGCPIGRLTQDPAIFSDPVLRQPVNELFTWVQARLAQVIREGQQMKEIGAHVDPGETAALIAAVLQGGYVLARASASPAAFFQSTAGLIGLLRYSAERPGRRRT